MCLSKFRVVASQVYRLAKSSFFMTWRWSLSIGRTELKTHNYVSCVCLIVPQLWAMTFAIFFQCQIHFWDFGLGALTPLECHILTESQSTIEQIAWSLEDYWECARVNECCVKHDDDDCTTHKKHWSNRISTTIWSLFLMFPRMISKNEQHCTFSNYLAW